MKVTPLFTTTETGQNGPKTPRPLRCILPARDRIGRAWSKSVSASQAARIADLPHHHRDPFDRLLIAQALSLPARLFTADAILLRYSELVQEVKPVSP